MLERRKALKLGRFQAVVQPFLSRAGVPCAI